MKTASLLKKQGINYPAMSLELDVQSQFPIAGSFVCCSCVGCNKYNMVRPFCFCQLSSPGFHRWNAGLYPGRQHQCISQLVQKKVCKPFFVTVFMLYSTVFAVRGVGRCNMSSPLYLRHLFDQHRDSQQQRSNLNMQKGKSIYEQLYWIWPNLDLHLEADSAGKSVRIR